MITASRYHDISCGHRVHNHESKCAHLHGHNYRFHFDCVADELDDIGRVIDFTVIKEKLCMWLEWNWDHRMLIWSEDPMLAALKELDEKVVEVPFNPTAENMAIYFTEEIAPALLHDTGVTLRKCTIDETRKCSASYELPSK